MSNKIIKKSGKSLISVDIIEKRIFVMRGEKVMVDRDLAELYSVTTKRLNEQVKRNLSRFPDDFMFQLTNVEKIEVVAICDHLKPLKYSKVNPYVFTEKGVAMLSSVLNSERAIQVNILIMRTFSKIREMLFNHKELALKLEKVEQKLGQHDEDIQAIINLIRQLHAEPEKPKTRIGFYQNK
ncbi:MAG: ORF6N domain-containing protein [Candidatus Omnitrophica bacterium]|nr:ORF6N domain-containing protein [Candidatus Omnitrophota bacterium]